MNKIKLVVLVFALLAVLGISVVLYPRLKAGYEAALPSTEVKAKEPAESSASEPGDEQKQEASETVPDFTVLDMDSNTVSLSDQFGKPIIMNFWATWCGPCLSELPAFDSVYAEYGDKICFLMVNLTDGSRDTVDGTKSFIAENGYSFPVYFDTESSAALAYGIHSIPMTIFINADGTLMDHRIGTISGDTLKAYVEAMTGKK